MDTTDILARGDYLSFCDKRLRVPRHSKDLVTIVTPAMVSMVEHSSSLHTALASLVGTEISSPFSG